MTFFNPGYSPLGKLAESTGAELVGYGNETVNDALDRQKLNNTVNNPVNALEADSDIAQEINDAVALGQVAKIGKGNFNVVGNLVDNDGTLSWCGLEGQGHTTQLLLGVNATIAIQNRVYGGVMGVDHWAPEGIKSLSINGQNLAQQGVIVGTDTRVPQTSIDQSANGIQFVDVSIMDVDGAAWEVGFSTKCLWTNPYTKDCDYGFYFDTYNNSTASDEWTIVSGAFRSHNVAGLVAVSDSVNAVSGNVVGASCQDNHGWGAYLVNKRSKLDRYTLENVHFESNGSKSGVTATDVTVRTDNTKTMEPSHLYVRSVGVKIESSNFFDGFLAGEGNAIIDLENCNFYSVGTNNFRDLDDTVTVKMDNVQFDNPRVSTDATLVFDGEVRISGTAADANFVSGKLPHDVYSIPSNGLLDHPSFESGLDSGFVASNNTPPTVSRVVSSTNAVLGNYVLRVVHQSSAGGLNDNALRFNSTIGTMEGNAYLVVSFFATSDVDTTLKLEVFNDQYGNNMGQPVFNLKAGELTRCVALLRNRNATAITTVVFGLYPTDAAGATIDYDLFCVEKTRGGKALDALPILKGGVKGV